MGQHFMLMWAVGALTYFVLRCAIDWCFHGVWRPTHHVWPVLISMAFGAGFTLGRYA